MVERARRRGGDFLGIAVTGINTRIGPIFALRVAGAILSYAMFIAVGRTTDAVGFRNFAFLFSVVSFLGPVATLGQGSIVFRYFPALFDRQDPDTSPFLKGILRQVVIGNAMMLPITIAVTYFGVEGPVGWSTYVMVVALILLGSIAEILFAVDRVRRTSLQSIASRDVTWRATMIVLLLGLHQVRHAASLNQLLACLTVGNFITVGFFIFALRDPLRNAFDKAIGVLSFAIPLSQTFNYTGLTILGMAVVQIDVLILGLSHPTTALSAYFAAQRINGVMFFFSQSVGVFAGPAIGRAWAQNDLSGITRLSRNAALSAGSLAAMAGVVLAIFAPIVMGLFRPEFAQQAWILRILLVGPALYTLAGFHAVIPTQCGTEQRYFYWRLALLLIMVPIKIYCAIYLDITVFAIVSTIDVVLLTLVGLYISRAICKAPAL